MRLLELTSRPARCWAATAPTISMQYQETMSPRSVSSAACWTSTSTASAVCELAEVLLGLDLGTSAAKGVLTTPDGTIVAQAERPHRVSLPQPGWVEHAAIKV